MVVIDKANMQPGLLHAASDSMQIVRRQTWSHTPHSQCRLQHARINQQRLDQHEVVTDTTRVPVVNAAAPPTNRLPGRVMMYFCAAAADDGVGGGQCICRDEFFNFVQQPPGTIRQRDPIRIHQIPVGEAPERPTVTSQRVVDSGDEKLVVTHENFLILMCLLLENALSATAS